MQTQRLDTVVASFDELWEPWLFATVAGGERTFEPIDLR